MQNDNFDEKIYSLLKKVPKGKITTYKILAEALNTIPYEVITGVSSRIMRVYEE